MAGSKCFSSVTTLKTQEQDSLLKSANRDKLNVNGGAIALGHPIGCTATRITLTLLHEMLKRKARHGLATLCVRGGMGMALALENVAA